MKLQNKIFKLISVSMLVGAIFISGTYPIVYADQEDGVIYMRDNDDNLSNTNLRVLSERKRLYTSGEDRYETCIKTLKHELYPDRYIQKNSVNSLVIASGKNYSDALSGAPLANLLNTNIFLVDDRENYQNQSPSHPKRQSLKWVREMMEYSNIKKIYVLGGKNTIPDKTVDDLNKSLGAEVIRFAGSDRYETSLMVAKEVRKLAPNSKNTIFVTGKNFPDALSASNLAIKLKSPIVVTNGQKLQDIKWIADPKDKKNNIIVGGINSVNIPDLSAERVSGNDRYETSLNIAKRYFKDSLGCTLVSGENFPDALSASNLYDKSIEQPLLLVKEKNLSKEQESYINENYPYVSSVGGQIEKNKILDGLKLSKKIFDKYASENIKYSLNIPSDKNGFDEVLKSKVEDILKNNIGELGISGRAFDAKLISIDKVSKEEYKVKYSLKIGRQGDFYEGILENIRIVVADKKDTIKIKSYFSTREDIRYIRIDDEYSKDTISLKPGDERKIFILTNDKDLRVNWGDNNRQYYKIEGATSDKTSIINRKTFEYEEEDSPKDEGIHISIGEDEKSKSIKIVPVVDKYLFSGSKTEQERESKLLDNNIDANELTVNIEQNK